MKVMVEVIPQLGTAVSGAGFPGRGRRRAGGLTQTFDTPRGRPENGSWKTGLLFSGTGESDLAPLGAQSGLDCPRVGREVVVGYAQSLSGEGASPLQTADPAGKFLSRPRAPL